LTGEGEPFPGAREKHSEVCREPYINKDRGTDEDPAVAELLELARKVLKSGNRVACEALERNIRYFAHAIEVEERFRRLESRLSALEERLRVAQPGEERLRKSAAT